LVNLGAQRKEEKMELNFTSEELEIQRTVRDFARKEIIPLTQQIENEGEIPAHIEQKMKEMNILRLPFPEEWGGLGVSFVGFILALEELAYASAVCSMRSAVSTLAVSGILNFGSEEMKKRYLKDLVSGEKLACWAFTESSTGSDPKQITTKAVPDGDQWVINGSKRFISYSSVCDLAVVFATTGDKLTAFAVERDTPGYSAGKREEFMGYKGLDNGEIILEDVRVPKDAVLGNVGDGFTILLTNEASAKIATSAISVSIARSALDLSVKYALEKTHRGTPIGIKFQMTQWNLANMATKVEAARWLLYRAASMVDRKENLAKEAAMVKLFVGSVAREVTSDAMQVHGAYGYSREFPIERLYREAKFVELGLGVSEIQRVIIANELLRK
jgi:alkylation response protein AidB-like acyl-CoA dehydrogenase